MYYQELIERMWNFNQRIKLGSTAIAMYLYLLKLGNDTNGYDVSVSDVAISNILGVTRKTVKPTKEKLRNLGLIQFENRNGFPCNYRLLVNYPSQISEFESSQKIKSKENYSIPKVPKTEDSQALESNKQIFPKNKKQEINVIEDLKTIQTTLEEFMAYAKTLDGYETALDSAIEEKYILWSENDWKNNSGRPINNWKSSLKSTLPYLKDNTDNKTSFVEPLPSIKRPKSIFN